MLLFRILFPYLFAPISRPFLSQNSTGKWPLRVIFQACFQFAVLHLIIWSEVLPWVVAEHFLHMSWPCLPLPSWPSTSQPAPSRAIFPAPGTRDCFAETLQQKTLKQICAKTSDCASRSMININHYHFWAHRACFVVGLSVFWAGQAKCAKTESSEPICLQSRLTSPCLCTSCWQDSPWILFTGTF